MRDMFSRILYPVLVLSWVLPSCAPKFSAAQRAELSAVGVARPSVDPDAYEDPYGGDVQARNAASNVSGAGAIGPLVGGLVGGAIAGTQNANFKGKNKTYFAAVRTNTPGDLGNMLAENLTKQLKTDPFFGPRLSTKPGGASFTSHISSYRLVRAGKDDNGLILAPEVYAEVTLVSPSGKKLAGKRYQGQGTSALPVAEYAASPVKMRQGYQAAVSNIAVQVMADMAIQTRE